MSDPLLPATAAQRTLAVLLLAAGLATGACSTKPSASALLRQDFPPPRLTSRGTEIGIASWYGPGFDGKLTANGERFNRHGMTAAHRTLPFGSILDVTDLDTGRSVRVRVNDRGPYIQGRVLDLSYGAAKRLGMIQKGTARVEIAVRNKNAETWTGVHYAVQVGAFRTIDDARAFTRSLSAYAKRYYIARPDETSTHYRIRVGPYSEPHLAYGAADRLAHLGFDTLVVEERKAAMRVSRR